MKSLIKLLTLTLFIQSCSHYAPLQMGSGEYSGEETEGCSATILGFPTEAENLRIDSILQRSSLKQEDVYSVEKRYWSYFFPIYSNRCTVLSINKSGLKKYNANYKKSLKMPDETTVSDEQEMKNLHARFKNLNSVKSCRKFTRPSAKACRRYFSLKKSNKQ